MKAALTAVTQRGLWYVLGSVVGRGLTALSMFLLARWAAPEALGAFFAALSIQQLLVLVSTLGQDTWLLRTVAGLPLDEAQHAFRSARRLVLVGSLLLGGMGLCLLLGLSLRAWEAQTLPPESWQAPTGLLLLSLPFYGLHRLQSMTLLGREDTRAALWIRQLVQPLAFLGGVALLGWSGISRTGLSLAGAYAGAGVLAALAGAYHGRQRSRMQGVKLEPPLTPLREQLTHGVGLLGAGLLGHLLLWSDGLLVGLFCAPAEVGRYGVVSRVALLGVLLLDAFNSALGPAVRRLRAQPDAIWRLYLRTAGTGLLLFLPVVVCGLLWPSTLLGLLGEGYVTDTSAHALQLLLLGQAVNVATGGSGLMLVMLERADLHLRNNLWAVLSLAVGWTWLLSQGEIKLSAVAGLVAGVLAALNLVRGVQVYGILQTLKAKGSPEHLG